MDKSLLGALQRMGSNFLVAAFVPAMAFIVISSLAFYPILPSAVQDYFKAILIERDSTPFFQLSFIALIFVAILGFTLYSLSTYIYKAFEGYSFILEKNSIVRRLFIRRQKRRFNKIETERTFVNKQLERVDAKIDRESWHVGEGAWRERRLDRYIKTRKMLDHRQYGLISERNERFPPSIDLILPTRFGNILRAAEMYPATRYAIDAVPLWGRLAHVIPKDGMEKLDEANNQCLFLLNATVLTSIFSALCLLISFYNGFGLLMRNSACQSGLCQRDFGVYGILAILAITVAWFFYEASLLNVGQYGSMIRTAYDLYRFNLLEALRLKLPTTLKDERKLWRKIGNFVVGNDLWAPLDLLEKTEDHTASPLDGLKYQHPKKTTTRVSSEP